MFLRFFGFGILTFEVSERHIQRFVTEPNSDDIDRRNVVNLQSCLDPPI